MTEKRQTTKCMPFSKFYFFTYCESCHHCIIELLKDNVWLKTETDDSCKNSGWTHKDKCLVIDPIAAWLDESESVWKLTNDARRKILFKLRSHISHSY